MNKEQALTRELQVIYSDVGSQGEWSFFENYYNGGLIEQYPHLLLQENILPRPDHADGFVLYSPSANQGDYEYAMAKAIDTSLSCRTDSPPLFIAADIFGKDTVNEHTGKAQFTPAFGVTEQQKATNLENVRFMKISADARHIPLQDTSTDVIWDRLGALWYAHYESMPNAEKFTDLLSEYKRVLRPKGSLVVDAAEPKYAQRTVISTANHVMKVSQAIEQLGWNMRYIGSEGTRLLVLTPTPDSSLK